MKIKFIIPTLIITFSLATSCLTKKEKQNEEQITISSATEIQETNDSLLNSVMGNVTMKQIVSFPNKVILTGLNDHRLVTINKSRQSLNTSNNNNISKYSYNSDEDGDESNEHFMPGIDILFGYNLLNIAHYDLKLEKGNFLFNDPVLVKTLYYPSFEQDSLNKQPINRNYYLVSVYDEDTNKDSLINKRDLRRFYYFDETSETKMQIIPADFSVIRSQYDSKNDYMYIFARHDANKNGTQDKSEFINVFWFSLKTPAKAKLLY